MIFFFIQSSSILTDMARSARQWNWKAFLDILQTVAWRSVALNVIWNTVAVVRRVSLVYISSPHPISFNVLLYVVNVPILCLLKVLLLLDKNINSSPGYIISVCSSKKIRWMTSVSFLVGLSGSTITVLCSGGKSRTDKMKIEVYGYGKTGNSIKISFNFNHLIPYRISVWLVSFLF